jgi:hypothetical protein
MPPGPTRCRCRCRQASPAGDSKSGRLYVAAGSAARVDTGAAPPTRSASRASAHAEQPQPARQVDALQALAGRAADRPRVQRVGRQRQVAGDDAEIVEAQLDADRLAGVALALQVTGQLHAQLGEDLAERAAVAHRMQVALEGGLAADRLRLAVGDDGTLVAAVRGLVQPGAVAAAELLDQEGGVGGGDVADRLQPEAGELQRGLRPDAVDLLCRQRPDARRDVVVREQRQAVGLVEFGAELGEQLVGRDADRAAEAGGVLHRLLQPPADGRACIGLCAGHLGQVDVDLVDAAVFDQWGDRAHRGLEEPRIGAVLVEVDRQQHGIGRQLRRLHHAHGRMHAERARLVGRGGDDTAARVVAQPGVAPCAVGQGLGLVPPAAADHHRPAAQVGIAQQLDRRIERVHVEVGDQPRGGGHVRPRELYKHPVARV